MAQLYIERMADAALRIQAGGRILYANDAASRLLGYSRDELLAMKAQDFDPDCSADQWLARRRNLKDAGSLRMESRCRRKDGLIFPIEISADYAEAGGQECCFALVHDISARKQAETAMAQDKHLFEFLMEHVPDHIYFKDRQSRFIRICRAHAELFGLSDASEAVGKTDFDFFGQHTAEAFADEQRIVSTGQAMMGIVEKETWADGRETFAATSKMPFRGPDGEILGIFGISRNITKSKVAENALRASEEFNQRILESTSDGVCVLDLEGALLYLSAGGRKLLDLAADDNVLHLPWLSFCEGLGQPEGRRALAEAKSGKVGSYRTSAHTVKAAKRWDVVISPITSTTGEVLRLVCIFRDITERERLETQLAQAQKLESIGQLAAGIAHEINTPIQYIGDNGRFLEDAFRDLIKALRPASGPAVAAGATEADLEYLEAEIPKAIEQLLAGVEQVARIVRAMKEFSHPGPQEKVAVDINRAIDSTVTVCRNEWKYLADLTMDLDPKLPPVNCVAGEFNQVMLNLIVNAAHAIADMTNEPGRKGAIRITTRLKEGCAEIRVSDTGPGIPQAIQAKIFDPFFTTKAVGKGTGQGLAIAHAVIVAKHQGTISFETEAGTGTTFIIRLPIGDEATENSRMGSELSIR